MDTKTLITEAVALPVEERAMMVDCLLRSLNQPESEVDKKWAAVARRRISELQSGEVLPIPAEEVFSKIWASFDR